jgi:regulatory protein
MSDVPDAYVTGLRLLARRELSTPQLRSRLAARGCPPDEVDAALERLRAEGALDDRRMARAAASTAARVRHRGRLRILRELEAAGVDRETAREAVEAVFDELDEAAVLERAIAKRLRGPIRDEAHFRRLHQYLIRLGFAPAAAAAALKARFRRAARDE